MPLGPPPKTNPEQQKPVVQNKPKPTTTQKKSCPVGGVDDVKKFQDWLDINHATWLNGGKLDKKSGYGNCGQNTLNAWGQYKDEYLLVKSDASTNVKSNEQFEIEKLNRLFKFYTKNSTTPIRIQLDSNLIAEIIIKSKDLNISIPLSYVRTIYEKYGDNIYQIAIPKNYESELSGKKISIDLQLEFFNSLFNILIEQSDEYVVLRIKNNTLEPKSYNDKSNITLRNISIQPKNNLKTNSENYPYPDKSNAVIVMKKQLGYNTDQSEIMTNEFSDFIKEYQKKNQLPVTGEIDYDLVIHAFPKLKPSETITTPPQE